MCSLESFLKIKQNHYRGNVCFLQSSREIFRTFKRLLRVLQNIVKFLFCFSFFTKKPHYILNEISISNNALKWDC